MAKTPATDDPLAPNYMRNYTREMVHDYSTRYHRIDCRKRCPINASNTSSIVMISREQIEPFVRHGLGSERQPSTASNREGATSQYVFTDAPLGGGVNNMLMNIAQLLNHTCSDSADQQRMVLVLPRLRADPRLPASSDVSLAFGDVFDFAFFQRRMRPCLIAESAPRLAAVERQRPKPIGPKWAFWNHLPQVYRSLRPSETMMPLVELLTHQAYTKAGKRWAAVHLPVEADWWAGGASGWCRARSSESFTQRCYSPVQVANVSANTRHGRHGASGTVLLYAQDKLSSRGPLVCPTDFGPNAFKLQLPFEIKYTFRNAAELLLAMKAPAGFYGNAYSTFSKGIALARWASSVSGMRAPSGFSWVSYDYTCARHEYHSGLWPGRKGGRRPFGAVVSHPGFNRMETLQSSRCARVVGKPSLSWACTF